MRVVNACVRPVEGQIAPPDPVSAGFRDPATHAGALPALRLSVLHDLICPWSRLGVHRLLRVLGRRRGLNWSISWEPFLLHAEMPRLGMAYAEYTRQKYGTVERARRVERSVSTLARAEGLCFRFERLQRMPSTIPAHWLIDWATPRIAAPERLAALVLSLSAAHFERGLDISLPAVLAEIAASHGLDPDLARQMLLRGREAADSILSRSREHAELGMNGIPCLVTPEGLALAGAQDEPALERMLDVALHWRAEPRTTGLRREPVSA